ncbi:type II secretion system protein N [Roseateles oligotrophus]|uniref:Type II secretion system protein N n=1 Tax=Roseateles oligotrophus TaxID=1769250 RepID=A0ABT2YEV0_9BURK|nr:type II secretion system protein N [Roseateles oligotrophus]MCV2368548.1 type II secretion system protein N [Roseateles oligotrophus]
MSSFSLKSWFNRRRRVDAPLTELAPTQWQDSRQVEPSWRGRNQSTLRWSIAGALLGGLLSLVLFAPASWLAHGLASASNGHLLITDTRGSIWDGSGVLVLTGGADSRDASLLPGRLRWSMHVKGMALDLRARQDCCINGELQLQIRPGWGRFEVALISHADWLARWPAGLLAGLGTPWNTLQLGGSIRLTTRDFKLEWVQGRWRQFGQLDLELINLSSRISTLAPLGSYRFTLAAQSSDESKAGVSTIKLITLDGALLLSGEGTIGSGKARFLGEASAAPGREAALNNLLNIIGRRQGARSVISIG